MRPYQSWPTLQQRVWTVVLSVLGLVIVAQIAWALLRPLLPVLLIAAGLMAALVGVFRWHRWRNDW